MQCGQMAKWPGPETTLVAWAWTGPIKVRQLQLARQFAEKLTKRKGTGKIKPTRKRDI